MKAFFINIVVSLAASFAGIFLIYNFVPLSFFEREGKPILALGSSITTILSTDTLKDSRAVINTNFNNLNVGKLEDATTTASLFIGNLTVGTLFASTSGATASSTFAGPLGSRDYVAASYFIATSTTATSTMAQGIRLTAGCFFSVALNDCLRNAISSISNSDGSLTISPTTGAVVASINLAQGNSWTGSQTFTSGFRISTTTQASSTVAVFDANGNLNHFGFPRSSSGTYQLDADGTTGDTIITHNLGRIPYRINIIATSYTDGTIVGNPIQGFGNSYGTATSTTSQYSSYSAYQIAIGPSLIRTTASTSPTNITVIPDGSGGNDWVMQLTAITSTTFTLNVTTNESDLPNQRVFTWEAF